MKRGLIGFTVLILVIGTLLSGGAVAKPATLNMLVWNSEQMPRWIPYAEKIAKDMGIGLQVQTNTFDGVRDKAILDFMSGSQTWDIILVEDKWVAEFAKLGLVIPIDDFVKRGVADPSILDIDDLNPAIRPLQVFNDKRYGLPFMIDSVIVLAYRKDIFEDPREKAAFKAKYGYELAVPETYDQYRDIAEFFTRKAGEMLCGSVLKSDFYGISHSNKKNGFLWHDYIPYMLAFGEEFGYDAKKLVPTWNSEANRKAAEFYVSLTKFMPPGHINMTSGEATSMFAQGKVAMQEEYYFRIREIAGADTSLVKDKYAVAPLPSAVKSHPTLLSTAAWAVYAKSKQSDLAYKFIERLYSAEYDRRKALEVKNYIPFRISTIRNPEIRKKAGAHFIPFLEGIVNNPKVEIHKHPMLIEYPQMIDIYEDSLSKALTGRATVEQALEEGQRALERLFHKAGYIK
ncbi:MAG: sugar ABC transporter substrate-binding protein [Firmicutes bacterium]|nr:sugar ABC transporter substrate-binding protein [Bacillota bacterium]